MKNKIQALAKQYAPVFIDIRHHLHAHPELSFQEYATAAFVRGKLDEYGVPYTANIAGTGIVATIAGNHPGSRTIAIRADMDALPITEANDVPYKSLNP
ncbi:MAG TPA: amidohydrolase, partial [Chitinophaga sp.]